MQNFGFIESKIEPTDIILDKKLLQGSMPLPEEYNYSRMFDNLKKVKNQGDTSKCVPYSLSYAIETIESMKSPNDKFSLDINRIYDNRSNDGEGMEIKEALKYLKDKGYKLKNGEMRHIVTYGRLKSLFAMKRFLYSNGPFVMALPVYDNADSTEFWKGKEKQSGHAICCVGYTEKGLILENTWGSGWGKNGKVLFPATDANKIIEAWGFLIK